MPRYDWKCEPCGAVTEVYRSMDDSGVGPHGNCRRCDSKSFIKQVSKVHIMIPGGRSENSVWPLKLNKIERFAMRGEDGELVRDPSGQVVQGYKDKTFANKRELDTYLESQGKCLMMDGEADSTFSETSQHSVYVNGDNPAPSERAKEWAEMAYFVEEKEAQELLTV